MGAAAGADERVGLETLPLRVRLFGQLDLRLGGEPLTIESARARSLLGYLLLHDEAPQSRQRLAFLLWPDSTEGQARTNLRNLLHTMRRACPELERILDLTGTTLQRRRDAQCWVDVAAFDAALEDADGPERGSDSVVAALRAAVDLYAGDLLEGCDDEWLVEERERFRDRYVSALRRLVGALADRGEHAEAVRWGRELVRCDPLQEDAHRMLMTVHDAAGDRAAAMRVYHECVATLQRELGVAPSPATQAVYATLVRPTEANGALHEGDARVDACALIGRDVEWEQLTRCWRESEGGRAQLVLVSGEPGVGKTRLVEELRAWCVHRGAVVAGARAYATEGELGYGVVISWLRSGELAAALTRAAPADRDDLARLLPELGSAGGQAPSPAADEAEQRRRLFDAVARVVAASGRPTLLVADDAQWCDAPSLQLVHYLVRLSPTIPLLVVATVRREELDDAHPLAAVARGLQIVERTTEIPVERLSRAETGSLAAALAVRDLTPGSLDDLYADTEGNPLFVVETIRGGWDGTQARSRLSPKLAAVIEARLRQLSEPAREVLGVAATVGRAFTAELVGAAAALGERDLVRALDELWRRGVIREHDAEAYDFTHGKIRDAAYDGLSPAARRHNHVAVASALERLHRRDPDAVSGQIAGNYDRAGRAGDAIDWYQRAAAEALRRYAGGEAVRLLERAHELTRAAPGDSRLEREFDVLAALSSALSAVDNYLSDRVLGTQRRAVEVAGLLGVEPPPPMLLMLGLSHLTRNDFAVAGAVATRLRAAAERSDDNALLVESEYLAGVAAFWSCDLVAARRHFEAAVARFRLEQRIEHIVRFGHDPLVVCLSRLGNTLWFLGHTEEARRARDEAVVVATAVGHPASRRITHLFSALLALDLGEDDRFRDHTAAMLDGAPELGSFELPSEGFRAYVTVLDGQAEAGIAALRGVIDRQAVDAHAPGLSAILTRLLVAAHRAAGDPEGVVRAADDALRIARSRLWEAEIRRLRAEFLDAGGAAKADVEAELARALDVARQQGALGLERRVTRTCAVLASG